MDYLSALFPPSDKNSCDIMNDKEGTICRDKEANYQNQVSNLHTEKCLTLGLILGTNTDLPLVRDLGTMAFLQGLILPLHRCHHAEAYQTPAVTS